MNQILSLLVIIVMMFRFVSFVSLRTIAIPIDIVNSSIILSTVVLESIVSTSVPDHVTTDLLASLLMRADSVNIRLLGVTSESSQDGTWGNWSAGLADLSSITESAPVLSAHWSSVLRNVLKRTRWGVNHYTDGINDVLRDTFSIPTLDSN